MLHELCNRICSKSITFNSLNNVRSKQAQFEKLCNIVNSGNKDMCMGFSELKPYLDECNYLQLQFEHYKNQISTLLEFCNRISHGIIINN